MDNWIQAIYDTTGIPLDEEHLTLAFREEQWWLVFHGYPVWPVGVEADPFQTVTPAIRIALAAAMTQRLSEIIPVIRGQINEQSSEHSHHVSITVVNIAEMAITSMDDHELERGWPHFVLRLSSGGFDVEVDLNPYVPHDPCDPDEVQRQAAIILEVARTN